MRTIPRPIATPSSRGGSAPATWATWMPTGSSSSPAVSRRSSIAEARRSRRGRWMTSCWTTPRWPQAVTFPVPHPTLGEDVAAAIVLAPAAATAPRDELVREIREFASSRLADFKVPQLVVIVSEIPKDAGGKVQRLELAERLGLLIAGPETVRIRRAPHRRWKRDCRARGPSVLGVARLGVHDNFFQSGGDSLKAAQVLARLGREFQIELPANGAVPESHRGGTGRGDDPTAGDARAAIRLRPFRDEARTSRARSRSPSSGCGSSTSSSPAIPRTTCTSALRLSGRALRRGTRAEPQRDPAPPRGAAHHLPHHRRAAGAGRRPQRIRCTCRWWT